MTVVSQSFSDTQTSSSASLSLSVSKSLLSTFCCDRAGSVIVVNVSELTSVAAGVVDEEGNIFSTRARID